MSREPLEGTPAHGVEARSMESDAPPGRLVTIAQAARVTGISETAIRGRLDRGTLAHVKVRGRRMIDLLALEEAGLLSGTAAAAGRQLADESQHPVREALRDALEANRMVGVHLARLRAELADSAKRDPDEHQHHEQR